VISETLEVSIVAKFSSQLVGNNSRRDASIAIYEHKIIRENNSQTRKAVTINIKVHNSVVTDMPRLAALFLKFKGICQANENLVTDSWATPVLVLFFEPGGMST
jgi:hypothetical protein